MLFTHKILRGEVLTLQDPTRIRRDFTYVADAVESLRLLADAPADEPWRAVNVGTGVSHTVMELVTVLESLIGKKAKTVVEAKPAFEAESTRASTDKLVRITGQKPSTSLADGLAQMVRWALERERQAAAAPRGPKAQAETRAETRGDAEFAEHLSSQFA
jgi:UDP-glucuronate 4-epimerase